MNKGTNKVLFIIPSLKRAGAETQVVDLANGLDPRRFTKYLFAFENNLDQLNRLDQENIHFHYRLRRNKLDFFCSEDYLKNNRP